MRAVERLPAAGLEAVVSEAAYQRLGDREWLASSLDAAGASPQAIAGALDRAREIVGGGSKGILAEEDGKSAASYVHRIDFMLLGTIVVLSNRQGPAYGCWPLKQIDMTAANLPRSCS